jgi:hypothetical protein
MAPVATSLAACEPVPHVARRGGRLRGRRWGRRRWRRRADEDHTRGGLADDLAGEQLPFGLLTVDQGQAVGVEPDAVAALGVDARGPLAQVVGLAADLLVRERHLLDDLVVADALDDHVGVRLDGSADDGKDEVLVVEVDAFLLEQVLDRPGQRLDLGSPRPRSARPSEGG